MIHTLMVDQPSFDGFCPVTDAVEQLAHHSCDNKRGAVFTKPEVVEFMLDLAGYTADKPLHSMRLLEPSFGGGEFLLAAVRRLLCAYDSAGNDNSIDLSACLRAVELHQSTFATTKAKLAVLVTGHGFSAAECSRLISSWLISADFLLLPIQGRFDFVVGNPPYVRQEMIPPALLHQYRRLYTTLYDRADLYVPFLERSLSLLTDGGQLAFICANRWTKNKYGGPLRAMVSDGFHLRAYVDMVGTKAFDSDVTAYPAITLIERTKGGATMVSERPDIEGEKLTQLAKALRKGKPVPEQGITLVERAGVDSEPWVLTTSDARALLRRLEARFPTLEDTGCKVGIGVATGADKTFIAPMCELDVEPSRKLALVTTQDIANGTVRWRGLGVINPFEDDGKLVDLSVYPKLMAYLDLHREAIMARHVARKSPANWYRTIDRITPSLAALPKLLIPDIKGSAHVVFEDGKLYPHHNLYFVVAEHWDLRALQAVLLSKVARHFVTAYSTTMRGGFLRFQAQYLRRIRLPFWNEVSVAMRMKLVKAATELDLVQCDEAAFELYELSPSETALLARN